MTDIAVAVMAMAFGFWLCWATIARDGPPIFAALGAPMILGATMLIWYSVG